MYTRFRIWLFAATRNFIPAIIKKNKQRLDMVFVCNAKKLIYSFFKTCRILAPCHTMQKHPHGIEANVLSPAKFPVYRCWIKTFCLPHLKLVDCGARQKIRAGDPWMLLVPGVCFFN